MKGANTMKENKKALAGKEKEKKENSVFYTILDRYENFCRQANIDSGDPEMDDRYQTLWFAY